MNDEPRHTPPPPPPGPEAPGTSSGAARPPAPPASPHSQVPSYPVTTRQPEERKAILAQQLQFAGAQGWRVESQSEFQAFLARGQQPNHVLHAILTVFTCLLWGVVWAVIAITGGVKREMVMVDEYGNVHRQALGTG